MEGLSRWVNLGFIFSGLVFWWVFSNLVESILTALKYPSREFLGENLTEASLYGFFLSVVLVLFFWKNKNVYNWGIYIAQELKKVTWPSWSDTKTATKTVIVVTIIIACILATFDYTFQRLTGLILGVEG